MKKIYIETGCLNAWDAWVFAEKICNKLREEGIFYVNGIDVIDGKEKFYIAVKEN